MTTFSIQVVYEGWQDNDILCLIQHPHHHDKDALLEEFIEQNPMDSGRHMANCFVKFLEEKGFKKTPACSTQVIPIYFTHG